MMNAESRGWLLRLALMAAPIAAGCAAGTETDTGLLIGTSAGSALMIYPMDPAATGPNPIQAGALVSAQAYDVGNGRMRIRLSASNMPANYKFGSHLHKLACDDPMKAGGHYQHNPWQSGPMGTVATDPAYANTANEAWLDFNTDAAGKGGSELLMDWIPRPTEAKAIIIHAMPSQVTAPAGTAGPKLACLPIAFTN
jgi:Cu/Zn superoxide dismutase